MLKVSPVTLRQAISDPAGNPVPRSAAKVLANVIYMADVMELDAELIYDGSISLIPTVNCRSNNPFAPPSIGMEKEMSGTDR